MSAESQELERTFLAGLQKHFKKPGPWLPNQNMGAGEDWPSSKGVSEHQVWEVYVKPSSTIQTFNLNGVALNNAIGVVLWLPAFGAATTSFPFDNIDPATGIVTWAGLPPTVISTNRWNTAFHGWLLTGNDVLSSTFAYVVRARRRFDLEE